MAFVTHTLPTPRSISRPSPSQIHRQPPRASGKISVSRRRRLYDFIQQTSAHKRPSPNSNKPTDNTTTSKTQPSFPIQSKDLSQKRESAVAAGKQRISSRNSSISAEKDQQAEQWSAFLAKLCTPPSPKVEEKQEKKEVEPDEDVAQFDQPSHRTSSDQVRPSAESSDVGQTGLTDEANLSDTRSEAASSTVKGPSVSSTGSARDSSTDSKWSKELKKDSTDESDKPRSDVRPSDVRSSDVRSSDDFSDRADALRDAVGAAASAAQSAFGKRASDNSEVDRKQDEIVKKMFEGLEEQLKDDLEALDDSATEEEAKKLQEKIGNMFQGAIKQTEDSLNDASAKAEEVAGKVGDKVGDTAGDAGSESESFAENAKEFARNFPEKVEEAAKDIKEKAEEVSEIFVEKAEEVVENVTEKVGELAGDVLGKTENSAETTSAETTSAETTSAETTSAETTSAEMREVASKDETKARKAGVPHKEGRTTIGEKLLQAIVDGVDTPTRKQSPEREEQIDKSYLMELISSGKIKKLTVTKLRRLLSANKLKTSGRKSELIARLTTFANSK